MICREDNLLCFIDGFNDRLWFEMQPCDMYWGRQSEAAGMEIKSRSEQDRKSLKLVGFVRKHWKNTDAVPMKIVDVLLCTVLVALTHRLNGRKIIYPKISRKIR